MAAALRVLEEKVAARCGDTLSGRPDWPCKLGCDGCCRQLARLPVLRPEEWAQLRQGLAELPAEQLAGVRRRVEAAARQEGSPYVCPMLEQSTGACFVYAHRPVACRTYGFYRERDKGLYCGLIRERLEAGEMDDVVWGNAEAVEADLARMGEAADLSAWWDL